MKFRTVGRSKEGAATGSENPTYLWRSDSKDGTPPTNQRGNRRFRESPRFIKVAELDLDLLPPETRSQHLKRGIVG